MTFERARKAIKGTEGKRLTVGGLVGPKKPRIHNKPERVMVVVHEGATMLKKQSRKGQTFMIPDGIVLSLNALYVPKNVERRPLGNRPRTRTRISTAASKKVLRA